MNDLLRLPDATRNASAFAPSPGLIDRPKSHTTLIAGAVGLVLLAALLWWLFGTGETKPHKTPPPPVHVATAVQKSVTVFERTLGTVLANNTVQVTSRVEGQLFVATFKEGDIVKQGQVLFQIDPRPFQAALDQAVATQNKDQAQLVSARNDAVRYATLATEGAASKSQSDQYVAAAKALEATVVADKANADAARLNLVYTKILSPLDGKTGPILIQPGNMVPANGNPLVSITQIHPIKISVFLPQSDLPQLQKQMASAKLFAVVHAQGVGGTTLKAPVTFIGNAVSGQTGTIELRATYDNQDGRLVPGQMVDASIALSNIPHAVVVPRNAVNSGPDTDYVYVLDKQLKATMQPVTMLYDDGTTAAIQGKVKPGDRVVTEGQLRLTDGITVSIAKGAAPNVKPAPVGAQ